MTDLAVVWDNRRERGDLALLGAQLATDNTLKTACILSLFCNTQADPGDVLPDDDPRNPGAGDRQGWWGDWYLGQALAQQLAVPGTAIKPSFRLGSKLWLLRRSKQTAEVLALGKGYASQSLHWLLDYQICSQVTVDAFIPRRGVLGLVPTLYRGKTVEQYRFDYVWGV